MTALNGKVALITGAARRIGAEISHLLHSAGMNIVLHYHNSSVDAEKLALALNKKRDHSAFTLQADLATTGIEQSVISKAVDHWGRLDVLVNNASRFYRTDVGKVSNFAWTDLMDSNVRAPFFLAQAAAPFLRQVNGSIINITDIHAESPVQEYSVYCISKAALLMANKALARELGPEIRVNAVAPGAIVWPEGENTLSEKQKEKIIAQTALGRVGNANDIAKTVLFLVRDGDYITGQVINVDGGRSI